VCNVYVVECFASVLDLTFEVKYGGDVVSRGCTVDVLSGVEILEVVVCIDVRMISNMDLP
jgi:hypothetical protein